MSDTPTPSGDEAEDSTRPAKAGRVLVVDDDALMRLMVADMLSETGHAVESVPDAESALQSLEERCFDVVIADVNLPGMDGLELAHAIRERGDDLPVLLISGTPRLNTALLAMNQGIRRYLVKPVPQQILETAVAAAVDQRRAAHPDCCQTAPDRRCVRSCGVQELGDRFAHALSGAYVAFQPIVRLSTREVFAYEALVRSRTSSLATPLEMIDAAERLHRVHDMGRAIRAHIAEASARCPENVLLFVNIHPYDLTDDQLYDAQSPLGRIGSRVVLEITERCSLEALEDVGRQAARLRALGYRLAVDDLGTGYSGLPSFTLIEPELVKIDAVITRDVHERPRQQIMVRSIVRLATELGAQVVVEGVETVEERDTLARLGCDLMQGYLFARPAEGFPAPRW